MSSISGVSTGSFTPIPGAGVATHHGRKIVPDGVDSDYVGRELRASPGEGYAVAHRREQDRIVRVALGDTRLYRDASFLGGLGTA